MLNAVSASRAANTNVSIEPGLHTDVSYLEQCKSFQNWWHHKCRGACFLLEERLSPSSSSCTHITAAVWSLAQKSMKDRWWENISMQVFSIQILSNILLLLLLVNWWHWLLFTLIKQPVSLTLCTTMTFLPLRSWTCACSGWCPSLPSSCSEILLELWAAESLHLGRPHNPKKKSEPWAHSTGVRKAINAHMYPQNHRLTCSSPLSVSVLVSGRMRRKTFTLSTFPSSLLPCLTAAGFTACF